VTTYPGAMPVYTEPAYTEVMSMPSPHAPVCSLFGMEAGCIPVDAETAPPPGTTTYINGQPYMVVEVPDSHSEAEHSEEESEEEKPKKKDKGGAAKKKGKK